MPISKKDAAEIAGIASRAIEAWKWALGSDLNPELLNAELIDQGFEAARGAIRDKLDEVAGRAGYFGYSESSLRGTFFPEIWKAISARGVMYVMEGGEAVPAAPRHVIKRLLKEDQDARACFDAWTSKKAKDRYEKRTQKQMSQILWNQVVVENMQALAQGWIRGGQVRNTRERCAQLLMAICWYSGRRPWEEAGLRAEFSPAEGPPWADGWVLFSGHAKKTRDELLGEAEEKSFTIPLFGICTEDFLSAFHELRRIQADESWYDPTAEWAGNKVKDGMNYYCQTMIRTQVVKAFEPVTSAGYALDFSPSTFRRLYASLGHALCMEWQLANGQVTSNINGYAKRYLGHFGERSEQDTAEYLVWTYLGGKSIPTLATA